MRSAHPTTGRLILSFFGLLLLASAVPAQQANEPIFLGQPRADYVARRKALMAKLSERFQADDRPAGSVPCVAILRGASLGDREDFEEGRFRQNNYFAYLTGVDLPGALLILEPKTGRDVLYLPARSISNAPAGGFSHRTTITEAQAKELGFAEVKPATALDADLVELLGSKAPADAADPLSGRCVAYTMGPKPRERDHSPPAEFVRGLRDKSPGTEFRELAPLIDEMRVIKTKDEIALLQRAIDITGQAEADVAARLEPGLFEYQLEAKLMHAFLDGGALRPGFASIVGSGPNACIPHYFQNTRKIENNDLVVVDIGAEIQNYTADITRTFPANGKFSPRQCELYQAVLDAQTYAANRVEPGRTRLGEMTGWVQEYLRNHSLRAKDANGNDQTLDRFFIHGLGHYLGMDVHDVGDYSKPMQPGMVFTIEPGLYIPYENIGIRIEDDYVITENGLEKMSGKIPCTPDEIEKLMAGSKEKPASGAPATVSE